MVEGLIMLGVPRAQERTVPQRPYVLSETNWQSVRETDYQVAVLPWGATEAHNTHLPYGTDALETEAIAVETARLAWEQGAKVVVLPTIPLGVQSGQLDIALCLHTRPTTQLAILRDVVDTVRRARIPRLVVLNGHGGNDFRTLIRELQPDTSVMLSTINWYTCVDRTPFFEQPGDHADEMETSLMLHLFPELVRPLEEAGPGREKHFTVTAFREGWAWSPRQWTRISDDTGVGDPRRATAAKGEAFFKAVAKRISGFLVQLAETPLERLYEGEG